jgi:hypothetical protein
VVKLATGMAVTVTLATAVLVHPAALVAVTEYCPESETAGLLMEIFCDCALKALGPVQLKEAPGNEAAERFIAWFSHTVLPEALSVGVGFTVWLMEVAVVQLLAAVTVRL